MRNEHVMAGKITISRWSGSDSNPRNVTIRVIDEISGVEFVSISVTPEELGLAITGQGHIPCEFTVNGLTVIGKQSENKTEIVPYDGTGRKHSPSALAALEVDGWKARRSDLTNHHCWLDKGIRVLFFRHVGKGLIDEMESTS